MDTRNRTQNVRKKLKLRLNKLAHNLEAVGSIPTPATNDFYRLSVTDGLFFTSFSRKMRSHNYVLLTAFSFRDFGGFYPLVLGKMYAKRMQNIPPQPGVVKPVLVLTSCFFSTSQSCLSRIRNAAAGNGDRFFSQDDS